jgi:hypothetical protein
MEVSPVLTAKPREFYTYRCRYCGFECRSKNIPGSSVPLTKIGNYGSNATPTPETFADEMYEATTIAFVAAAGTTPAYLTDSAYLFSEKHFSSGMILRISTTSGTNDGDKTIADRGVSRNEILLSDSDSLTTETAATAGTVTISRVIYKPNINTGCPNCGSLNSKR